MARRELYVMRLAQERERAQVTLVEKRKEMEKVRAKYLEASKERKVLDKLKERRAGEYYDRQRDEEFKTVDDLNTSAAVSRGINESAAVSRGIAADVPGGFDESAAAVKARE
jgi:flagellar FliJ protein